MGYEEETQKLLDEDAKVFANVTKLGTKIHQDEYYTKTAAEQYLLRRQLQVLQDYHDILRARISLATEYEKDIRSL